MAKFKLNRDRVFAYVHKAMVEQNAAGEGPPDITWVVMAVQRRPKLTGSKKPRDQATILFPGAPHLSQQELLDIVSLMNAPQSPTKAKPSTFVDKKWEVSVVRDAESAAKHFSAQKDSKRARESKKTKAVAVQFIAQQVSSPQTKKRRQARSPSSSPGTPLTKGKGNTAGRATSKKPTSARKITI
jgi:hypothetical protein